MTNGSMMAGIICSVATSISISRAGATLVLRQNTPNIFDADQLYRYPFCNTLCNKLRVIIIELELASLKITEIGEIENI